MIIFWCPAGVCKQPSFILPVTLQPLGTHQATIYHMKGDIHRFNMRYSSMPCLKRLLSYSISHLISQIALVVSRLYGFSHKSRYARQSSRIYKTMPTFASQTIRPATSKRILTTANGTRTMDHVCHNCMGVCRERGNGEGG